MARSSKSDFAKYLAGYTGLHENTVSAWLNHEQGSTTAHGGNNWLNVETGARGGSGPNSREAMYVESLSPQAAAKYTAEWLRKNQPSIVAAKGKGAEAEAAAIINSGWAESHYNHVSPKAFLSAASNHHESLFEQGVNLLKGPLGPETEAEKKLNEFGEEINPLSSVGIPNPLKGIDAVGEFFNKIGHWIEEPLIPVKFIGGTVLLYVGVRTLTGGSAVTREGSRATRHAAELAAIIPK